jgi:hypothetical protein
MNFFKILRNDLELFYKTLSSANNIQLKNISSFIINNFYDNIFSDKPSDELLTIIFKFLENEINNISQPENFLENTSCRFLLEGLFKNPEIKFFFNNLLTPIVEEIEENSCEKWFLSISEIKLDLEENKNLYISKGIIHNELKDNNTKNEFEKYIFNINKSDLEALLNKTEDDFIKEYIQKQINLFEKDEKLYSNNNFMEDITKQKMKDEIFLFYNQIFLIIIKVINYILDHLIEKMNLIPNILKNICKIIEILVLKKYNNSIYYRNLFIGKFFFNFIFCQFLESLDYDCLINTCIITNTTQENFTQVIKIIKKLFSLEFFNSKLNSSLIPFNNYFLNEALPKISQFFNEITKIKLSPFLEKIINNKNVFYYDFFLENPNELINQIQYCFNLYELNSLIEIVNNNIKIIIESDFKEEFDEEKKEKINKGRNLFKATIRRISYYTKEVGDLIANQEKKNKIFYFLLTNLFFNEDFSKYEKIKESTCFTKKELETVNSEEDLLNNNLIKIDNFLVKLLFSYGSLNERDFSEVESKNLIEILNELIKILKTGRINFNSPVPPEWYGKSLVNLLNNLPEKYKKNNYDEILTLLKNDIQKSIDSLDPKVYSGIYEKLKNTSQIKILLTYVENNLIDIEQNKKIIYFCDKQELNTNLTLKKNANRKKATYKFKTISNLIDNFPNMSMKDKNGDCLKIQKNDLIPEFLLNCLKIISEKSRILLNEYNYSELYADYENKKSELENKNRNICLDYDGFFPYLNENMKLFYSIFNSENTEENRIEDLLNQFKPHLTELLSNKIDDYIMNKLHSKIFPIEPLPKDITLYNKLLELNWIKPKNIIQKDIINYTFFSEPVSLIQKFEKSKSPISKMKMLQKTFQSIQNIIKFNLKELYLGTNQIIPIFVYILIKAKPKRLWSNLKYIQLYLGYKIDQQIFFQFQVAITMIETMDHNRLINVSQEEFENNCKNSLI